MALVDDDWARREGLVVPPPDWQTTALADDALPRDRAIWGDVAGLSGDIAQVTLSNGITVKATIPGGVTIEPGDAVAVQHDSGRVWRVTQRANLRPQPLTGEDATLPGDVSGYTSSGSSASSTSTSSPGHFANTLSNAGGVTLQAINENRGNINALISHSDVQRTWLNNLASDVNSLVSRYNSLVSVVNDLRGRTGNAESAINNVKDAASAVQDRAKATEDALVESGQAWKVTDYGGGTWKAVVEHRRVDYGQGKVYLKLLQGTTSGTTRLTVALDVGDTYADTKAGVYVKVQNSSTIVGLA